MGSSSNLVPLLTQLVTRDICFIHWWDDDSVLVYGNTITAV